MGKSAKDYRLERDGTLKELEAQRELYQQLLNGREKKMKESYDNGYKKGVADGYKDGEKYVLARTENQDTWFHRNQYNEAQVKRLKEILGEVMQTITRKML